MTQINKIRNDKEVTTDTMDKQSIINKYYEQLYGNQLDNIKEIGISIETYNLPKLNQEET